MSAPNPITPFLNQARRIGQQSGCLPPDHPVWGVRGSPGAARNYQSCLETSGTFFGIDPRDGSFLNPGETQRVYDSPLGLGPIFVQTVEQGIRGGICENDPKCLEFIVATDPVYGRVIQLERLERGVKPVLTAADFQSEEAKAALLNEFATNPFANASLTAALRGDTGIGGNNLFAPQEPTGVSGNETTMEMVMTPPAPDMGGVWDSRTSAGDVDSARAFNEPIRIGTGQAPLYYSAPFVAGPSEGGGDNTFLTLLSLAGLALALWRK